MKMRHISVVVPVLALMLAARGGEIIERIAATVNGAAILQSDWDDALHFEAFVNGQPPESMGDGDRKASLNRLIDQALVRQQMEAANLVSASDQEVTPRVAELRRQHPAGATDDSWRAALARYGLDETDVSERVRAQLDQLRFIELRFRPSVRVTNAEIEQYYREEFLPQLRRAGAQPKPLAEVEPQIEELLTEQRVSELFTVWLQNLRSQARIAIRPPPLSAASAQRGSAEAK